MYFPEGTNGVLSLNGKEICKTIELPWRNNKARVSCIPEGIYKIRKRFSAKFKWHLELINVKNRKYILQLELVIHSVFHPTLLNIHTFVCHC